MGSSLLERSPSLLASMSPSLLERSPSLTTSLLNQNPPHTALGHSSTSKSQSLSDKTPTTPTHNIPHKSNSCPPHKRQKSPDGSHNKKRKTTAPDDLSKKK